MHGAQPLFRNEAWSACSARGGRFSAHQTAAVIPRSEFIITCQLLSGGLVLPSLLGGEKSHKNPPVEQPRALAEKKRQPY